MTEMTQPPLRRGLGTTYDAFLHAAAEDDDLAGPLSTVSALARLDLDPWQEAAELARLPQAAAKQRLSALLGRLPDWENRDTGPIATRLVALLPNEGPADGQGGRPARDAMAPFERPFLAIGFAVALALLLTNLMGAQKDRPPVDPVGAKPAVAAPSVAHGELP